MNIHGKNPSSCHRSISSEGIGLTRDRRRETKRRLTGSRNKQRRTQRRNPESIISGPEWVANAYLGANRIINERSAPIRRIIRNFRILCRERNRISSLRDLAAGLQVMERGSARPPFIVDAAEDFPWLWTESEDVAYTIATKTGACWRD